MAQGATAGISPRAVAEDCPVVFVCVSDTPDVEAVVLGADGIRDGVREGFIGSGLQYH